MSVIDEVAVNETSAIFPNSSSTNSTNSTTATTATPDEVVIPDPLNPIIANLMWGTMTSWLLVDSFLLYTNYNAFASNLNTYNVGTYSTWTTSYIKSAAPISNWFTASYFEIFMHGSSWMVWALNLTLDNNGGTLHNIFVQFATFGVLMPIIDILMTVFIYTSYQSCSSLTSSNFDSTSGTTQYVSCSSGTTSSYGTSGTIAKYVTEDPYNTIIATQTTSGLFAIAAYFYTLSAIKQGYTDANTCVDVEGNEVPCNAVLEDNKIEEQT